MAMNFAMLPPEIISGKVCAGPGSGSMTEAATAWARLATRLYTAVADYRAVTSKLAARRAGTPAAAMAQAAEPYIDWLNATAQRAERAATQAAAAADAHEAAVAAVVPPSVIAANRAQRKSLIMANSLGLAGPAIADTESAYDRMWAADAAAIYGYARASADAAAMTPFTLPPGNAVLGVAGGPVCRTWTLKSAPELISAGRQVVSKVPDALRAIALSPPTSFDVPLAPVTCPLSMLSSLSAPSDAAINYLNALNKAAALRCLRPGQRGVPGAAIAVRVGRATSIRTLSVPRTWATAATPIAVYHGTVA